MATALIRDVALPRRGALNSFEAGKAQQINRSIFYAVLRSLDRMTLILGQNYKDSPVVSTELVKFLSMNTSVEAVEKLVEQTATFQLSFVEMQRKLNTVVKDCGTVGNKVDSVKTEVTAVKARVLKLRDDKWEYALDLTLGSNHAYTDPLLGNIQRTVKDNEGTGEFVKKTTEGGCQQDNSEDFSLVRPARATESGILQLKKKISFACIFQTSPIWLLDLDNKSIWWISNPLET